jgi:molybdopterin molybdotransferase
MVELEKALQTLGKHLLSPGRERIELADASGRFLAEELRADRDMPPFHKASMDGYACRKEDLPGPLEVLEMLPAGQVPSRAVGRGQCSRIMTGGQVPQGADCVIMQEEVDTEPGGRIRFTGSYSESYISRQGEDLRRGDLLLEKGTWLEAQHLGMLAAAGNTQALGQPEAPGGDPGHRQRAGGGHSTACRGTDQELQLPAAWLPRWKGPAIQQRWPALWRTTGTCWRKRSPD